MPPLCRICKKEVIGYKPISKIEKGKEYFYCLAHAPSFYVRCPFCSRVLLTSNPENDNHILVLKGAAGILMCPKLSLSGVKHSFRFNNLVQLEVPRKEAEKERRKLKRKETR